MIPGYPDEKVIKMIRGGLKSKKMIFGLLFLDSSLRSQTFSVIQKLLSDKEEQEKIYLDGLIEFIQSVQKNKFNHKSSLKTFFIAICRILCLRILSNNKKTQSSQRQYFNELDDGEGDTDSVEYNYIELEESRYEAKLKRRVYKQLSNKCRTYVRQKYGNFMSIKEMSEANKIKIQSIKNLGRRCENRIRALVINDPEIMEHIKSNNGRL